MICGNVNLCGQLDEKSDMKVIRIHPAGIVNVCTKCHGNQLEN